MRVSFARDKALILITGGGSGGHVYPALSISRYLQASLDRGSGPPTSRGPAREPGPSHRGDLATPPCIALPRNEMELAYVGSARGMERTLAPRAGIPTFLYPMAPPTSLRGVSLLALATLRSALLLLRSRPRVTFATGGYVSVPAGLASWLLRVPLVLFLPDVVPGKAVSFLVPLARTIAVSTDAARRHLPAHTTVVTGYPVREVFQQATRQGGRERFELPAEATVLTVFGGSQGARSINTALLGCLPDVLEQAYVLHICGEQRLAEAAGRPQGGVDHVAAALSPAQRARYRLYPYLHDQDMALALAAADLALSRSGASILGELPAAGTPAVLVPLPKRTVHQRENAAYLADRGAAVILEDGDLQARLGPLLHDLLADRARLTRMAAACRALARPQAAQAIAALIREAAL